MSFFGTALRMTVYLNESDHYRHRPLYTEIVHRAHAAGEPEGSAPQEPEAERQRSMSGLVLIRLCRCPYLPRDHEIGQPCRFGG
jgi:Uncharacterized ACR, COG1993